MLLPLTAQPTFGMDPEQAGREARQSLKALMEKQRKERKAADTADKPAPPRPAKADDNRAAKSVGGKLPSICRGC